MSNALIITEVAKVLLTAYMTFAKEKGLTDNEIDVLYFETKKDFSLNDPAKLEDV